MTGQKEINRHAATLVLSVLIKLFNNLLEVLDKVFEIVQAKRNDKMNESLVK